MMRLSLTKLASSSRRNGGAAVAVAAASKHMSAQRQDHEQQTMSASSSSPLLALNPAVAANAFRKLDQQMVRSFRLDQVLSQVSPNDVVVARQDATRYSFIGFKDISALDVSRSLLLVPEHMRHFHTVCAREDAPCDFYADVDLTREADGEEALLQITDRLSATMEALKFGNFTTVILNSQHAHKQSYHLHVRGEQSAFTDFRAVRGIADSINLALGTPTIDMSCYRYNGTLRTAFCAKMVRAAGTSVAATGALGTSLVSHLVPYEAKDSELRTRLRGMTEMSAEQIFEASLATRQIPTESLPFTQPLRLFSGVGKHSKLAKHLRSNGGVNTCEALVDDENDDDSNIKRSSRSSQSHRFLREDVKWLRYKYAAKKVRQLPISAAEDYNTWVSVGLALHSFGGENNIFDEWMRFSAKCPEKFSREACHEKWMTFNGSSDAGNWRRGYNYLTSTVWRQLGMECVTNSHLPRL